MNNFNLIESPWIPVRWRKDIEGSTPSLVSLAEAFTRGDEIADLQCAPHERIALIRLLVCVSQAALGAPEDPEDWDDFGKNLSSSVPAYLQNSKIFKHFELLGEGPRFLQEDIPETGTPVPASKLFSYLSTGNNPTLLDHGGMLPRREFSPASISLALLTFQNYNPRYGAGYLGQGPCADGNAVHCIICGETLSETVKLNCLDKETIRTFAPDGLGLPIWHSDNREETEASTTTLLGRLVPRHRSLKLTGDLSGFHLRQESLQYPTWEPFREPSCTLVTQKEERRLLRARTDRSIWRDLHNLTVIGLADGGQGPNCAPVLQSHHYELEGSTVKLWSGALVTDKAKIVDTIESSFTIPWTLFCTAGRNTYDAGINHAEEISKKLFGAIKYCYSELKHNQPPTQMAQNQFWHILDQGHGTLINLAANPEARRGQPTFGDHGACDEWTLLVRSAANTAYELACPRTTPRQIQAYSAGRKALNKALFQKKKAAAA